MNNEDRYFGYDWLDRLSWANNNNSAPEGSPSGYYQKWTYDLAGRPTRRERKLGSGQVK